MRARWYDPHQGQFVSEDPIRLAGGINPYVYAADNPVNFRDPSGLCVDLTKAVQTDHDRVAKGNDEYCTVAISGLVASVGRGDPFAALNAFTSALMARSDALMSSVASGLRRAAGGRGNAGPREAPPAATPSPEPLPTCEIAGDKTVNSLVADLGFLTGARGVQSALGRTRNMTGPFLVVTAAREASRREARAWGVAGVGPVIVSGIYNEGEPWYLRLPLLGSTDKFATMLAVCMYD